ncbi:hypothetical protein L0657_06805 [Dyadobacter sp. CY345]|uniref:hypothetical protein n=1 Tax=Dyadobacter sp. CY345 TaxID=2909335 RepID=UPI001F2A5EC6|nr:hypothetical protein [Dyadobacter sp. CY345]MCF2443660.1 hypothetical protein [Dyadobacter sp. CY345]
MQYELVKSKLSGDAATIYSIKLEGEKVTQFEKFLSKYYSDYKTEINSIVSRLKVIGNDTGLRLGFYKENEGALLDGVCALFDSPNKELRVYFLKNGKDNIILGGGGPKSKAIRAYQEDEILDKEANIIKQLSKDLTQRIKAGDIFYLSNGEFGGRLNFIDLNDDEE